MRILGWALLAFLVACGSKSKGGGDEAPEDSNGADGTDSPAEESTDGAADGTTDGAADGATDGATDGSTGGATPTDGAVGDPTTAPVDDPYGHKVEPTQESVQAHLVNPHCVPCHQGATPAGALDLTNLGAYVGAAGDLARDHRFLIVPGHPELSLIVRAILDPEQPMPPTGNALGIPAVKAEARSALETWILNLGS